MGYFDALARSSFKQVEGRWLFYPWGALGRGYAIPTESQYLKIHTWVKRSLQIWLPLVILTGILAGWAWAFVLLPVFGVWYFTRIRTLTKGLEATTEHMTVGESYRAQAQGHSLPMLWFLEVGSVAFVAAGVVILALDPRQWLIAIASIGFFGACAAAIGFMIADRGKKSNR
jgi:hypothetical protein